LADLKSGWEKVRWYGIFERIFLLRMVYGIPSYFLFGMLRGLMECSFSGMEEATASMGVAAFAGY
jgi:hypothetical protein